MLEITEKKAPLIGARQLLFSDKIHNGEFGHTSKFRSAQTKTNYISLDRKFHAEQHFSRNFTLKIKSQGSIAL